MCITVGVRAYLGKSMNRPAMRNLWRHNLACAIVAQRLASTGSSDKDTAFTSGILHDIGRIALSVIQPSEYAALLDTRTGPADRILDVNGVVGWNHCDRQRLIADWKLPPTSMRSSSTIMLRGKPATHGGWRS